MEVKVLYLNNRRVFASISDTTLLFPGRLRTRSVESPLDVLVIVQSAPANVGERHAISKTWGKVARTSPDMAIDFVFLVGTTTDSDVRDILKAEVSHHDDVIQEDFVDSYNNLTLKSVMMLKFLQKHQIQVQYIFKVQVQKVVCACHCYNNFANFLCRWMMIVISTSRGSFKVKRIGPCQTDLRVLSILPRRRFVTCLSG